MSKLRKNDVMDAKGDALPDETALFLIAQSVATRKSLIYGRLNGPNVGEHCAIGCFWEDNPKAILHSSLIDEVAAVNDSVLPSATGHQRWKVVNSWLRFKIATLANRKAQP